MSVVSRGEKAINERYRPMRLSEMIGNDETKAKLAAWMAKGNKRSRSLMLCGASSGGKTTTARILAMGLNCEAGDTTEPCLECESCRLALNKMDMHIVELNMSELTGKDDSTEIVQTMYAKPLTGRNKVYILDEVQMLSKAAQNQLLKIVEQPPENVYLIFCTTEPDKLIVPLRNRMEQYRYSLPTRDDIKTLLGTVVKTEGIAMTDEQKRDFFLRVQGMTYREILFSLEQLANGGSMDELPEKIREQQKFDPFTLAKEIVYKGNFTAYTDAIKNGVNIEFEGFRLMMRTLAAKELEKLGFADVKKAALYYDIFNEIDKVKCYDSNSQPTCSALVWRVCAELKSH